MLIIGVVSSAVVSNPGMGKWKWGFPESLLNLYLSGVSLMSEGLEVATSGWVRGSSHWMSVT